MKKPIKLFVYSIASLLPLSILFFLFSLIYSSLESLSAQQTLAKLKEAETLTATNKTLFEEWQQISKSYKSFQNKYLMPSDQLQAFRQQMQMTARKNGIGTFNMISDPKSVLDVINFTFKLEMTGNYQSIKRFIFDVENKTEMILVKKIQLQKRKNTPLIDANIEMEVYFVR